MHEQPLDPARPYLLKHNSQSVSARVLRIAHAVDINTLDPIPAADLPMNGIGLLQIETTRPIAFDAYRENRTMGAAILIDPATNATAGALMIGRAAEADAAHGPVTVSERAARYGHRGGSVSIGPRETLAALLERQLFDRGANVHISNRRSTTLELAGVLVIVTGARAASLPLPDDDHEAAAEVLRWLHQRRILHNEHEVAEGEGI
jgi:hypothetical protein